MSLRLIKVSDVRRRGATTEAYRVIRRKEERSLARLWREGIPPEADERSRTCPCESRDDALMVDQEGFNSVAIYDHLKYT